MSIETGGSRGSQARDGRYISRIVGNAVESVVDGSVTGTDNSASHRVEYLRATAKGQRLHIPEGRYIWNAQSVALTGECIDGGGITGVPGRTIIYVLTADNASNFHCLTFDGTLEVDGINTTPTYHTTEPAPKRATTVKLNNLADLYVGEYLMFVDKKNNHYHYADSIDGTPVGKKGQVVRIEAIGAFGPFISNILSGSIDADNILTIINAAPAHVYGIDAEITLSSLTGTGDFAFLEGTYITLAPTVGTVTTVLADGEFAAGTTITGGIISYGTPAPNSISFYPALEEDISGSDTGDPLLEATCIRRFTRHPKDVVFSGITFRQDKTKPMKNTQAVAVFNSLDSPLVEEVEINGRCVGLVFGDGTHHFRVDDYMARDGGPLAYGITITGGACWGRIRWARGFNGRHLINTTASLTSTCIPKHIRVIDSDCEGMALTGFADHPGSEDLTFEFCRNTGGRSTIAYGFQIRGHNGGLIECESFGCAIGANIAYGSDCYVRGGLYKDNGVNVQVTRAINTVLDNPICDSGIDANFRGYLQLATDPYNVAWPGLDARLMIRGDEPAYADFLLVQANANFAYPWDMRWLFRSQMIGQKAIARRPTHRLVRPDRTTLAFLPFMDELAGLRTRKYDDFTVPGGLDAEYLVDTKNKSVVATLPDSNLWPNQRIVFRHVANASPFTFTVVGTIDGVPNRVVAVNGKLVVYSDARIYKAVSGTYTPGNGLVNLQSREAVPFTTLKDLVIANATGTGAFALINGAHTTASTLSTNQKTIRYFIATGQTMTIGTADIIDGRGWCEE